MKCRGSENVDDVQIGGLDSLRKGSQDFLRWERTGRAAAIPGAEQFALALLELSAALFILR